MLTTIPVLAGFGVGFCILFAFIGTFTYVNVVLAMPPLSLDMMDVGLVYLVFAPSILTTPFAGRLAGPPSEEQTAQQVQRHVDDDPSDLLAAWVEVAPRFEAAIAERGALPAAIDLLTHEQDLRHALGRPGGRDDELVAELAAVFLGRLEGSGLELRATPYEVFRAAMGRRTIDQVRALDWSGDPEPAFGSFFVFGPAAEPVREP